MKDIKDSISLETLAILQIILKLENYQNIFFFF